MIIYLPSIPIKAVYAAARVTEFLGYRVHQFDNETDACRDTRRQSLNEQTQHQTSVHKRRLVLIYPVK